ncbi:MAG: VOC family protein [Rhodococcus sp. (in: high G+C Gram-positive bacteria)]|jgi:catechol 2,3-dioxygenase-like lactoylglutathione lyase family enzyme|uniref:VOC family protein n=1 Tax=Rhodococcus sp. EPR-157 TaxID=1813677 RepID=UPI0007BBF0E6|nr:VOC family protein [Rhodococcus sp. EPR-157]KZE98425.1 glyoxalase [Rhodococcus sp. EPR-157]
MSITFNHTIIATTDPQSTAQFYLDVLEATMAPSWGPFVNIQLDDHVMLQFASPPVEYHPQHYAFLVDDALFDRAYDRIRSRDIEHWADPQRTRPGETNTEHDGRGVYFLDPGGNYLELITRPYF